MSLLVDLIKQDEGLRLNVYDDATGQPIVKGYKCVGNPTIGYGRLLTSGRGISLTEAGALLFRDIDETVDACSDSFPWFDDLDETRAAVIASMVFNMGLPRFMGFKKLQAAAMRSDWSLAAKEIMDSKAARDLPKRYNKLAKMIQQGDK